MSSQVDIKGLDKAKVLQALFNNSKCQGNSFLSAMATGDADMSLKDAQQIVCNEFKFDYLRGRVMKVNIGGDSFDPWGYDRDNGEGAAARAIASIREKADDQGSTTETAGVD